MKISTSDKTLKSYIEKSKVIGENTKNIYLKKLSTIQNFIYKATLRTIMNNPYKFEKLLLEYCNSTKGRGGNEVLGDHAKQGFIIAIISLFHHNQKLRDKHFEIYEKWDEIKKKYSEPIKQKYLSNEPTPKQKDAYVTYEQIVEGMKKLNDGSPEKLLLAMYVYIPPVRSDYVNTKIYEKDPLVDDENYIVMNDSEAYVMLHCFKTKKWYKEIRIEIPDILSYQIKKSLELNPREYLFVSSRSNKPYTSLKDPVKGYNSWANETLKKLFNKPDFSLTMLRHIYISRKDLDLANKSGLEQDEIARIMGHSVETQRRYYWR